ncbi:MAG: aspartate aminotransferase family protein [Deltaproteobacteria bacterium]|nr:aspartate aminotransferase family protein [Deltaproteobacteria bacterium]
MTHEQAQQYAFLPFGGLSLKVASAQGSYFTTADGRRILDAAAGAIAANVGHWHPEVIDAAARALREVSYVVPPFVTEHRARLVERLRRAWLPAGLTRCIFASGGSEAVDLALRIARQHFVAKGEPGRFKVIGRALSYHGTTFSTLDVGGHAKRRRGFEPWLHDWPKAPACYALRCESCRAAGACNLACADGVEEVIERAGADSVAAVILEPIGGSTAGALVPPDGYLPRVAEICRRRGVLLIADEVMCGFGRTGAKFAVDHFGVTPDLMIAGKGLAAGYAPMSGVYATEEVAAPIGAAGMEVMYYTYSAHPASCAIADKVLEIMERDGLAAELGDHPNVAEIRGRGLLLAIELVRDRATREPFPAEVKLTSAVVGAGLAHGAFFYPGGCPPAQDVVVLGPPLNASDDELDACAGLLRKSLDAALSRIAAKG